MHLKVFVISSVVMALAVGILVGAWSYGFSQYMWLEDELGTSDGKMFEYLADTPPAIVTMNYGCLVAIVLSVAELAWSAWGMVRER